MTPTRKDGLLNFDGSVANANQQEHLAPTNPHGDESTVMGEYKTLRYANGPKKSTSCIHTHIYIYIIYQDTPREPRTCKIVGPVKKKTVF